MQSILRLSSLLLLITLLLPVPAVFGENILIFTNNLATEDSLQGLETLARKLVTSRDHHNVTILTKSAAPGGAARHHARLTYYYPASLKYTEGNATSRAERQHELEDLLYTKYVTLKSARPSALDINYDYCKALTESAEFNRWLSSQTFDLVIVDKSFEVGNECSYGIAARFGAKTVSYSSSASLAVWDHIIYRIPAETWWVLPPFGGNFKSRSEVTLWKRLASLCGAILKYLEYKHYQLPRMEALLQRWVNTTRKVDFLKSAIQQDSLYLLNHEFSNEFAKAYPPFVIAVGGLQIVENQKVKIAQEVTEFLGKDQFVLMYFGWDQDASKMSEAKIQALLSTISKMSKTKFIWISRNIGLKSFPPNLLVSRTRPTSAALQALFSHPQLKAFVSNGDQHNLQYASHFGVPVLIIPLDSHQGVNAQRMRKTNGGIEVRPEDLAITSATEALEALLTNASYSTAAKLLSEASKTRPMSSLDTAFWWIEHVLQTEDLSYLKPVSMHQPWWTTFSFDVHLALFLISLVVVLTVGFLLYFCSKSLTSIIMSKKCVVRTNGKKKQL